MDVVEHLVSDPDFCKHNIFNIPELRKRIFISADKESLARCARVCSSWSDNALDALWGYMETFTPLFNIISPLEPDANGLLHFKATPRHRDWGRFYKYARRIRTLWVADGTPMLANDAIAQIYQKRPTICLTQKLSGLRIYTVNVDLLEFSLLFMHEGLEILVVSSPAYSISVQEFCEEIATRASGLKDLRFCQPLEYFPENIFLKLISSLLELEIVHFPCCNLLTPTIRALSLLPRLRRIAWGYLLPHTSEDAERVHLERTLNLDSLATLKTVSLTAALPDIKKFISLTPNLTSLAIRFYSLEGVRALYTLLETVSQCCCNVRELYIQAFPKGNTTLKSTEYLPSSSSSSPIPSLPNLTIFTLFSPFLLFFNDSKLVHFVSGMPSIERLYLSPHPDVTEEPVLTLDVLPEIARVCPKLQCLSLHVDCTKPNLIVPDSHHVPIFENLDRLDLGYSPISKNILPLSQLLSRLCRPSCRFDSRLPVLFDGEGDVPPLDDVPICEGRWGYHSGDLNEAARLFFETRDEGKRLVMQGRAVALEEKNVALKERDAAMERLRAAEAKITQMEERLSKLKL